MRPCRAESAPAGRTLSLEGHLHELVSTTWAVACTAASPVASASNALDAAQAIHQAATQLLLFLEQGKAITTAALRTVVTDAFGGTDAQGLWVWKDAYDALDAAQVLFLRFRPAILDPFALAQTALGIMKRVAELLPAHTRSPSRSRPCSSCRPHLPLDFGAAICSSGLVLEPSAGTGLFSVHPDIARASLALNALAATRS